MRHTALPSEWEIVWGCLKMSRKLRKTVAILRRMATNEEMMEKVGCRNLPQLAESVRLATPLARLQDLAK
jgi:hypothetical protein